MDISNVRPSKSFLSTVSDIIFSSNYRELWSGYKSTHQKYGMGVVYSRSPWCFGFQGSFLPTIDLNHQKSTAASRASSAVCYEGLSLQRLAFESELCCRDALNILCCTGRLTGYFSGLGAFFLQETLSGLLDVFLRSKIMTNELRGLGE